MWPRVDDSDLSHYTNQRVGYMIPFLDHDNFKGLFQFSRIAIINSYQEVTGEFLSRALDGQ